MLLEGNDHPEFYTTRQIAEIFQVTTETVRNWLREGKLPYFKIGGEARPHFRVKHDDLKKFAEERYHLT